MEVLLLTMVDDRIKEHTKKQLPLYVAEGLIIEREKSQMDVAKMIADAIQQERKNLRSKISSQINDAISNHIPSYKFKRLHVDTTPCRPYVVRLRDQDDPYDDAYPEWENSAKRQKTSEHRTFKIPHAKIFYIKKQKEPAKPKEVVYSNLKIVQIIKINWELGHEYKFVTEIVVRRENGSIVLITELNYKNLNKNDIEDMYLLIVNHKIPHAKIFYIKKQKEPTKPKEVVYSNLKIVQIIKINWELGHEYKFVTEIVVRRENGSIVSITESNYKNLNKNDIEDMYLLIVNHKVNEYAETCLLWSLSVFIRSTVIWERVHDFQLVYGIIYKNSKKEKRVMRHQEIHKLCDVTLKRVLEWLKSYNIDVKHGYITPSLSKEDDEYLQLFEEEIEE
nr:hypothetical protein [Tanacetum cinerariifolium]